MKRILSLLLLLILVSVIQIIFNIYIPGTNLDIFGITVIAILMIFSNVSKLNMIFLSLIADILGQYYFGTHLLVFALFLIFIRKYSLFLTLCELSKKIISLNLIGLSYYLILSSINFLLQHVFIDFKSCIITFCLMPFIFYKLIKISELEL